MSPWKWVLAVLAVIAGIAPAQSQEWPQRPVKIIVPFAPGGNADGMARMIGQRLSEVLSQQFVVENRTGAGGAIAVESVARPSRVAFSRSSAASGVSGPVCLAMITPSEPTR